MKKEAFLSDPKNILEIGVGCDLLKKFLKDTFPYKTLDISKTLKPDIVGDVVKLPLKDNVFDLIVCFQTLEHLPFSEFERALKEIARVSRKDILISLPLMDSIIGGSEERVIQ